MPFVSAMAPTEGPAGGGSSVRFFGGEFAVSVAAVFRCVAVSAATRLRITDTEVGTCLAPRDSFVECQVPVQGRGESMLALEYSAGGSAIGPWERAQAFYVDTGRYYVTGRSGVPSGLRIAQTPAVFVQGEPPRPAARVELVDDFGDVVSADSATIVRMHVVGSDGSILSGGLGGRTAGASEPSDPLAVRAEGGVAEFGDVIVRIGGSMIGAGLRVVFSADGCTGTGAVGVAAQPVMALARLAGLPAPPPPCLVRDVTGACCSISAQLDECGSCVEPGAAPVLSCGIRLDLPAVVKASAAQSAERWLTAQSALQSAEGSLRRVLGYRVDSFSSSAVFGAGTSGGIAIDLAAPRSQGSPGTAFSTSQLALGQQVTLSIVIPPPAQGWTAAGALSRRNTELRLREASWNASSPLYSSDAAIFVAPDIGQPAAALTPQLVCLGLCVPGSACPDCTSDPVGFTTNSSLAEANCSAPSGSQSADPGRPGGGGQDPGSQDAASSVLPVATSADEALALLHAAIVALGVVLAMVQGLVDTGRAVCGRSALHAGPGSAIAHLFPAVAAVGMGVLDLAEHGHFALALSQLHAHAPAVVRRTSELMVSTTGLLPGAWAVFQPILGLDTSVPDGFDQVEPTAISVLRTPLSIPASDMVTLAAATLVAAQLVVFAVYAVLAVVAVPRKSAATSARTDRAAGGRGRGSSSSALSLARPGLEDQATETPGFSGAVALVHRAGTAMVTIALVFFGTFTLIALNDINTPSSQDGEDGSRRTAGWVGLLVVSVGFTALEASLTLLRQPLAWCPGPCGRMGLGADVSAAVASPHLVHAYEGRGARLVDPTGRASHEAASGRAWLLAKHVDRILTAVVLVWLAPRPGAQAGAFMAKQVLLLTALLALRPTRSSSAWGAELLVTGTRVATLLLCLAFVAPLRIEDIELSKSLGTAVVAIQILVALMLVAFVAVRSPPVARLVSRCCPAGSTTAGTRSERSAKQPSLRFAATQRGVPKKARGARTGGQAQASLSSPQSGLSMHSNPMSSLPASPDQVRTQVESLLTRTAFSPLNADSASRSHERDLLPREDIADGSRGETAEMECGREPSDMLDKDAADAACRAGRQERRRPADNPMLSPRKLVGKAP